MLIGYTPQNWLAPPQVQLQGGQWLTADQGAACVDGQPARVARYRASGVARITLTLPAAAAVGIVAVLGLRGVAPGAHITAAAGGRSASAQVVQFADGSLGAYLRIEGASAGTTVTLTLPAGTVDVGEIAALPVVEVEIERDWSVERIDPSDVLRTRGAGRVGLRRRAYRVIEVTLCAAHIADVRGGGLAAGIDWEQLAEVMLGDRRVIVIPRAAPAADLQRTALYGIARMQPIQHVSGNWYRSGLSAEEVPAA